MSYVRVVGCFMTVLIMTLCMQQQMVQAVSSGSNVLSEKMIQKPSVRLQIPKIKLNVIVDEVGLNADGAVDVPKDVQRAGWFRLGPRPGERGSAVIVGHFGRWKNGVLGVFNHLGKIKKGDRLFVTDANGDMSTFVVKKVKIYSSDAVAADVFQARDDKSHLNLITCTGVWSALLKRYPDRLVVFTDKE